MHSPVELGPAPAATRRGGITSIDEKARVRADYHRPLWMRRISAPGSAFPGMVAEYAEAAGVDPRALGVRTLLHLPRIPGPDGRLTRAQVAQELTRTGAELRADVRAAGRLVSSTPLPLRDLRFERIQSDRAEAILGSLHYLRSARPGSVNFALVDPLSRLPVSLCSVSPLEWRRVGSQLYAQFGVPQAKIWDVSRVYSCAVAPANAISFLLARVRDVLARSGEHADLLTTAVDLNLGFTGASYRAANWQQWLTVQPRPYLYLDGRYVSPRQLRQRFGTANLAELAARHPGRTFEQSRFRLLDSLIFCCRLRGETQPVPSALRRRLHR